MLSVNISPAQFRDPEFESRVVQVLARCHFPARRLQVEVTESYVMENPERARAAIENMKALGRPLRWMILASATPVLAICAASVLTR